MFSKWFIEQIKEINSTLSQNGSQSEKMQTNYELKVKMKLQNDSPIVCFQTDFNRNQYYIKIEICSYQSIFHWQTSKIQLLNIWTLNYFQQASLSVGVPFQEPPQIRKTVDIEISRFWACHHPPNLTGGPSV